MLTHTPFCEPWIHSTGTYRQHHHMQYSWIWDDRASHETHRISCHHRQTRHRYQASNSLVWIFLPLTRKHWWSVS